ncbi:neprilysin-1-like [Tachypleus tridentatus]|uniref:neprilysin-1-like n=1 Tax=Tachypleus tridentatus TaxID=6853 RepID=UPI003FD445EE
MTIARKWLILATLITVLGCGTVAIIAVVLTFRKTVEKTTENIPNFYFAAEKTVCLTDECKEAAAGLLASMNQSVDPCSDFYTYSCGGWINKAVIPDSAKDSIYDMRKKLEFQTTHRLKALLEGISLTNPSSAVTQMKKMYTSCLKWVLSIRLDPSVDLNWLLRKKKLNYCLDEKHCKIKVIIVNRIKIIIVTGIKSPSGSANPTTTKDDNIVNGVTTLKKMLNDVGGWPLLSKNWTSALYDWVHPTAWMIRQLGTVPFISFTIAPDFRNTSTNVIYLGNPGIQRSLITQERQHRDLIQNITKQIQQRENKDEVDPEENDIAGIFEVEKTIKQILDRFPPKDEKDWMKMTVGELMSATEEENWLKLLQQTTNETLQNEHRINMEDEIIVQNQEFLTEIVKYLKHKDNKRKIANYIGWRTVLMRLVVMPKQFRNAYLLAFHNSELEQDFFCVTLTANSFVYAATHIYLNQHFVPSMKPKIQEIVDNLKGEFRFMLNDLEWMDDETKEIAERKAKEMVDFVAYPDIAVNITKLDKFYSAMEALGDDDIVQNLWSVSRFLSENIILKLRLSNSRTEWDSKPLTTNAIYYQNKNSFALSVSMLDRPFYYSKFPRYMNYGAIGAVIGHEITHGFDVRGSKRDEYGNANNWWTEESRAQFNARANCFVKQYNAYEVNGTNTLAENIADNGGVRQALKAYRRWVRENNQETLLPNLTDFTQEQLFFLSYGSIWCAKYNNIDILQLSRQSKYALPQYRVIGSLSNMAEFAEVFNCKAKSTMNPARDRCVLW